jgi:hypothetical protein
MTAMGQDALVLAWRQIDSNPGAERGSLSMVSVSAGGAVTPLPVPQEPVVQGVPTLLIDPASPGGWMALGGEGDETSLVALDVTGRVQGAVHSEPALGRGTPLALRGKDVLLARPQGPAVTLERVTCGDAPLPPVREEKAAAAAVDAGPQEEEEDRP